MKKRAPTQQWKTTIRFSESDPERKVRMLLTVLIAEDDPKMRHVLKKVAEENDAIRVVGEAADGTKALMLFEKLQPDVVFIDINLPGKDGVNLAREIFDAYSDENRHLFRYLPDSRSNFIRTVIPILSGQYRSEATLVNS
ncbi:MAG: response regulator [Bacillota bacterium]